MLPHPPPGTARRRLAFLCVVAAVALAAGIVVGAGGGSSKKSASSPIAAPPERAVERAAQMPLSRQIGEVLMISFKGPGVPRYARQALRAGRAAGVILFRGNATTPAAMRSVTTTVQRAARGQALIAVDQEGGAIRILPWAAPQPSQAGQPTPAAAKAQALLARRDLAAAGINVNLAPIADVGTPGSVMRERAFPGGTSQVAQITAGAIRGYRGGKVAPTLKHFPGFGAAGRNTDDEPVTISSAAAAIRTRDLPPFRAGIKAGAPLVMASHALYPDLDRRNIASQSRAILTGLLRDDLGFEGVVITDSMEAAAVLDRSSLEVAALRSMNAGADLLLLTGAGSFARVYEQLLAGARRSAKFRRRIAGAAARVIALKRSLGLEAGRR
jgi:beta-N-acetylhexosaminidase